MTHGITSMLYSYVISKSKQITKKYTRMESLSDHSLDIQVTQFLAGEDEIKFMSTMCLEL